MSELPSMTAIFFGMACPSVAKSRVAQYSPTRPARTAQADRKQRIPGGRDIGGAATDSTSVERIANKGNLELLVYELGRFSVTGKKEEPRED